MDEIFFISLLAHGNLVSLNRKAMVTWFKGQIYDMLNHYLLMTWWLIHQEWCDSYCSYHTYIHIYDYRKPRFKTRVQSVHSGLSGSYARMIFFSGGEGPRRMGPHLQENMFYLCLIFWHLIRYEWRLCVKITAKLKFKKKLFEYIFTSPK